MTTSFRAMARRVPRAQGRFVALLLLTLLIAGPALALDPVNASFFGGAIKGYDPVAYFTEGKAVKGSKEFTYEWNGATWRFSSAENRDLFAGNPEHYAPQYGGYCAWAVAQGKTAGIDPAAFQIVEGRLYLNYSRKIQERWAKDIPGNIAKADENWPALLAK